MASNSITEVKNILAGAATEGVLDAKALKVIDVNDMVLAGIDGTDVDDIFATDVILLTYIIDDSGSITSAGLVDRVIEGQNRMIDNFQKAKNIKDRILIAQWKLGSKAELIHSYIPVDQAVRLTRANYRPSSGTALYDTWIDVLAANIIYAQKLKASGTPVRSIVAVITDGFDQGSRRYGEKDCALLNRRVLMSEQFILAFAGVAAGSDPSAEKFFRDVADNMGFPAGAVHTASSDKWKEVFDLISQKSLTMSQKGSFNAAAQNSFFNNP